MNRFLEILADALQATFNFIGQGVQFLLGLIGVILITGLSLSGEVIDEFTTYKSLTTLEGFPWGHVLKVMIPPMSLAIVGYLQHRKGMAEALNAGPRETPATIVKQ